MKRKFSVKTRNIAAIEAAQIGKCEEEVAMPKHCYKCGDNLTRLLLSDGYGYICSPNCVDTRSITVQ
jgi:hypothetical protein